MEETRRPTGYIVFAVIAIALIAWLTGRYLHKRALLRDLGSNDMAVRVDAARKLLEMRKLEDSLPAQPIIRRSKTAEALGEIGSEDAMRVLGVILRDQEDAPRRWARQALEDLGERAVPTLLAALSAGGDPCDQALEALAELGPSVAPKVRFFMLDGGSRDGATWALAEGGRVGVEALLRACHNPDNGIRSAALGALGGYEVEAAVGPALENVKNPPHGSVKTAAIKALGLIGDRRAVPDLIPRLEEKDFREAAVTSLGQIGDPRAVQPILATLTATDKRYRNAAVLALRRIGAPAFDSLVRELRSREVLMQRAAAAALVGSNTRRLNVALASALRDEDPQVRASAALALGWDGNLAAVEPLHGALVDPSWRVVDAAVKALGEVGVGAIARLQDVLRDPTETSTVRYQVARAMAAMGDAAVDPLIAALSQVDPEVQKWSAVALGEIGQVEPQAVEALEELERAGSSDVKWVAGEQLRRLRRLQTL